MFAHPDFAPIAALDLRPIHAKLCHAASGEGWSAARADAAEREYRRFLFLMKRFPHEQTVPSVEVDTFWHYHILDTVRYAADCERVFGYFLHHDPSVGLEANDAHQRARGAARMQELYEACFGAAPSPAPAAAPASAYCGVAASAYCGVTQAAYCGVAKTAAAYCGVAKPGAAYCGVARQPAAYCGVAKPSAAYCGVTTSAAAYCGVAAPAAAYCGVARAPRA